MTVSLWDGHFDPDELAIKPVSTQLSSSHLYTRGCIVYYPVVRNLEQHTVLGRSHKLWSPRNPMKV